MGSVLMDQTLVLVINYVEGPNLHNLVLDQQYPRVMHIIWIQICEGLLYDLVAVGVFDTDEAIIVMACLCHMNYHSNKLYFNWNTAADFNY